jgi:hypothetical protein
MKRTLLFLAVVFHLSTFAQRRTIIILNPSFEGIPKISSVPPGWQDLGFSRESPPDTHPNGFWGVNKKAYDGNTYMGMVARKNGTWERMGQPLPFPLIKDSCYSLSVHLSKSMEYLSGMIMKATDTSTLLSDSIYNFQIPLIFKIMASTGLVKSEEKHADFQLLAQSPPIYHEEWKKYTFTFKMNKEYDYLILEAYYPDQNPVNGHLLIDGLSNIVPINACQN